MFNAAVEEELAHLNDEIARLRIMVNRCNEMDSREAAPAQGAEPQVQLPLSNQPMAILPGIFSGVEGTARLFRVLMDTYPWLVPVEVKEAMQLTEEVKEREKARVAKRLEREAQKAKKLAESSEDEQEKVKRPTPAAKEEEKIVPIAPSVTSSASQPQKQTPPLKPTGLKRSTSIVVGGLHSAESGTFSLRPATLKTQRTRNIINPDDSDEEDPSATLKPSASVAVSNGAADDF